MAGYCQQMTIRGPLLLLLAACLASCSGEPARPVPAANAPPPPALCRSERGVARYPQVPARARRRCRRGAAVCGRLRRAAATEKTLIWHLYEAALAGRDIFIDQKHRDALEMRRILEQIVAHPQGVDARDARRDPALHEALLDQQRALQQPDRAQVRPEVHAAGVCRRGQGRRAGRRRVRHAGGRIARRHARAPAADVLRRRRRSDGHQQDAGPGQGHPRRAAPTTCIPACRWPT